MSLFLHYASFGVRFQLAKPLSLDLGYIYRFRGSTSDHLRLGFQQTQQHSTLQSRSFHSSTVIYGVEYRF